MQNRLAGKIAIVTGAARGMGKAHASLLASFGSKVVITDRSADIHQVAAEIGENALSVEHDLTDHAGWPAVIAQAARRFGHPNVLVNNAGVAPIGTLEALTAESLSAVLAVNCVGTAMAMQAVIPAMRAAGGGSIVNISSILGLRGAHPIEYCISKFGVTGMTKSAAGELAKYGIRVNSVHPGFVETEMLRGAEDKRPVPLEQLVSRVPLGRIARPVEISHLVAFLASDESSYCTGAEFTADGGQLSQV